MSQESTSTPKSAIDYSSLGLIANPFDLDFRRRRYGVGIGLATHAMLLQTLARLASEAASGSPRPMLIDKGADYSSSWHVRATTSFLRLATDNKQTGVLAVYVPLELFRLGRVRGALSATAERVAFMHFLDNLAAYARDSLTTPDTALDEWQALADIIDPSELLSRIDEDPHGVVQEILGEALLTRDPNADPKKFLHLLSLRQNRLHPDPSEDDETYEIDEDDPYAEVFTVPASEMPSGTLPDGTIIEPDGEAGTGETPAASGAAVDPAAPGEPGDEADSEMPDAAAPALSPEEELAEVAGDYIIAYVRTQLSPVIARGLRAYRAQGVGSMMSEWKITKAPKKTLKALITFACRTYNRVALMFDHFERLLLMPDDTRELILATLTELRLATREQGMMVLLRLEEDAPELTDLFGNVERVLWDYPGSDHLAGEDVSWSESDVDAWLAAGAIEGAQAPRADSPGVAKLIDEASGDLDRFADAMSAALIDAASRGATEIDDEAVAAGIAAPPFEYVED